MGLAYRLRGVAIEAREPVITAYLNEGGEKRWLTYKEFYDIAASEMEKTRKITIAESNLIRREILPSWRDFSVEFQAGCVAYGKKPEIPRDYLKKILKAANEHTRHFTPTLHR